MSTCVICKHGEVKPGTTSLTVERGAMTLVIKGIPARVCATCGGGYFDKETTQRIEAIAHQLPSAGVEVGVRQYAA